MGIKKIFFVVCVLNSCLVFCSTEEKKSTDKKATAKSHHKKKPSYSTQVMRFDPDDVRRIAALEQQVADMRTSLQKLQPESTNTKVKPYRKSVIVDPAVFYTNMSNSAAILAKAKATESES